MLWRARMHCSFQVNLPKRVKQKQLFHRESPPVLYFVLFWKVKMSPTWSNSCYCSIYVSLWLSVVYCIFYKGSLQQLRPCFLITKRKLIGNTFFYWVLARCTSKISELKSEWSGCCEELHMHATKSEGASKQQVLAFPGTWWRMRKTIYITSSELKLETHSKGR